LLTLPLFLPSSAYFIGYGWSKDKLVSAGVPAAVAPLAAGFFADAIAAPLWMPSEVITSRMQIQGPGVVAYASSWHAARSIVAEEGVQGLFRGLGAQVLAFGPASALWWASYEATASMLGRWSQRRLNAARLADGVLAESSGKGIYALDADSASPALWIHASSGLVAGLITSLVTNPIDVAKTRLQTQHVLLQEYDAQARGRRAGSAGCFCGAALFLHVRSACRRALLFPFSFLLFRTPRSSCVSGQRDSSVSSQLAGTVSSRCAATGRVILLHRGVRPAPLHSAIHAHTSPHTAPLFVL
jgi:hypothetical protein